MLGEDGVSSNVHNSSLSASRDLTSKTNVNSSCLPAGPHAFTVRKRTTSCTLITGPVVVEVLPSLPVKKMSLVLETLLQK